MNDHDLPIILSLSWLLDTFTSKSQRRRSRCVAIFPDHLHSFMSVFHPDHRFVMTHAHFEEHLSELKTLNCHPQDVCGVTFYSRPLRVNGRHYLQHACGMLWTLCVAMKLWLSRSLPAYTRRSIILACERTKTNVETGFLCFLAMMHHAHIIEQFVCNCSFLNKHIPSHIHSRLQTKMYRKTNQSMTL